MRDPKGPTGEMPVPQPCTAMHSVGSRRRGLIPESDGTQTSKCPYMGICNQPRRLGITADFGAYIGTEQCRLQDALLCTPEVGV